MRNALRRMLTPIIVGAVLLATGASVAAVPAAAAPARSVQVIIKNDTDQVLSYAGGTVNHGIVTAAPPRQIAPAGYGSLFAESNGVATGTEGRVRYRLAGVPGEAVFHWDNPFVGSNSADGSAPPGYRIEQIGDTGNRTLVFFTIHPSGRATARCNPGWVLDHLGKKLEDRLGEIDKTVGFLTTPFKRIGVGGWVDTGCQAEVEGWPVRDAQHSTDGFWTIDVKLRSMKISGTALPAGPQRFVRIEVEPGTPAHAYALARKDQFIRFHGVVLIDTHHGDQLVEVHPWDPIHTAPDPMDYGPDTCKQGFVWREAVPSDHVCVTPETRQRAAGDNAQAASRRTGGGLYGPDTCKQGFVWRETVLNDHVCVTPPTRAQAQADNQQAASRRVRP